MLVTAAYEGPPYNPVTPSPVPTMATAPPLETQAMTIAGLGNRRISPVPGCVNCVGGLGQMPTGATKIGLMILGAVAVIAIGVTIYGASKK